MNLEEIKMTNQEIIEAIEGMTLLQVKELVDELKEKFGTKVSLVRKGTKGTRGAIEIEFYSEDELERLLELLRS